jgi:uncharacterized protein (DUF302 family)
MGLKAFGWQLRLALVLILVAVALIRPSVAFADDDEAEAVGPYPGTVSIASSYSLPDAVHRLEKAVRANGMTLVQTVNSGGRGQTAVSVILVSSSDYWGRILKANQLAGMEMPIRIYVTDTGNHTAAVIYRAPSSIFALYDSPDLDKIAIDLDQVFAKIVDDAIGE